MLKSRKWKHPASIAWQGNSKLTNLAACRHCVGFVGGINIFNISFVYNFNWLVDGFIQGLFNLMKLGSPCGVSVD